MRDEYSVRSLCRAFGVSESGFYAYSNRPKKKSNLRDQKDCQMIWKVYLRSRGTIGAKATAGTLKSQFHYVINHKRVARLVNEMNLKSRIRMRKSPEFTVPKEVNKVYPNRLERDFDSLLPNRKWVADLTEFSYFNQKFYGCAIIDLFDRQVVAFHLSDRQNADLVIETVLAAKTNRQLNSLDGLLIHTDRGTVFASTAYRKLSLELKFQPSMSRKANCWDNAVIESFFSHLKTEFPFHSQITNQKEVEADLYKFIVYYNTKRGQKRLGYLSPEMYYQAFLTNKIA